jgi:hypothetical protein
LDQEKLNLFAVESFGEFSMRGNIRTEYRQGLSYARGVTIDLMLTEEDVQVLYEKWQPTWPEKIEFQGGVQGITCDMLYQVPHNELVAVYGKKRAARYLEIAAPYKEV